MPLTCEKLIEFNLLEEIEKQMDTDLTIKFFVLFNHIQNIDQFIKDSPSFPGTTDKIIRNELTSVIGATLSIEGTILEKEEIEESFKKAEHGDVLKRKEQEAENSRKVYTFIRTFVNDNKQGFEYSEQLIKQIHTYFTENMNYVSNVPGKYRTDFNVSFGEPRKNSLCRTQSEIEEAMKRFIMWLNAKKDGTLSSNIFVKAMMAHYYLGEIHPFGDGNGRTARALEALILNAHGVNNYCFWSWANFWSSHKDQYLSNLHNIRITLNPTDFIIWGLEGYKNEISDIKRKVLKKVKQLMFSDYIHYLERNKKNETIKINLKIVDVLQLLILKGRIPLKKFLSSPEMIALYANVSSSTRVRHFQKMLSQNLIKIGKSNSDSEDFIEPNFEILEYVRYYV
jgi:Fic family protein